MRVLTVVGARPQFVKLGPVSRALRGRAQEVVVHTGQHYDRAMDAVFFEELGLPKPAVNLGVGGGSHAEQTARMLEGLEREMLARRPDVVLIYGDTNSTLAGALAAAKLKLPVAHVEAGLRSFDRGMPEEINRVVADRLSALLFCPTRTAVANLKKEGITAGVYEVGDVMYESLADNSRDLARPRPQPYFLATLHRAENATQEGVARALEAFGRLPREVVWPVHPRVKPLIEAVPDNVDVIEPVSYLGMLALEKHAEAILTDSGGVQKEAYWLGVPCVTLRDRTEWVETLAGGWNVLTGLDPAKIARAAARKRPTSKRALPAKGASEKIVRRLLKGVR